MQNPDADEKFGFGFFPELCLNSLEIDSDGDGILDTDEGKCGAEIKLLDVKKHTATGAGVDGIPNISYTIPKGF